MGKAGQRNSLFSLESHTTGPLRTAQCKELIGLTHPEPLPDDSGGKLKYDQKRKQHGSASTEGFQMREGETYGGRKKRGRQGGKPERGDVTDCKRGM